MDVQLPDGRVLKGVPDGTTKAQLAAKLQSNGMDVPAEWMQSAAPAMPQGGPAIGGMGGFNPFASNLKTDVERGAAELGMTPENVKSPMLNALGPLESVAQLGSGGVGMIAGGLAGIGQGMKNLVSPGMPAADRVRQVQDSMTYQPRTGVGNAMSRVVGAPMEAYSAGTNKVGEVVTDVTGLPSLGTAVKTAGDFAPALLTDGAGVPRVRRTGDYRTTTGAAPTKDALKRDSAAAYKRSEDVGAVVREDKFGSFQKDLAAEMQKSGIDATLHPDATAALKRVLDEKGPMTVEKLETLRRIAQDAEGSIKPADARKAGDIVDAIDEMADGLVDADLVSGTPEAVASLKEARDLWSRARKADVLDELMRRAELSAPNFSASGMENAIRTEFRALAKNERRFKRFTKEEQEAITRVAKGGPVENGLRMLGKLAPTGVVSTALGTGLGFLAGGPAGAALLPAAGGLSRLGAKNLTLRNANAANELVRRGPQGQNPLSGRPPLTGNNAAARGAVPAVGVGNAPSPLSQVGPYAGRYAAPVGSDPLQQIPGQAGSAAQSPLADLYLQMLRQRQQ